MVMTGHDLARERLWCMRRWQELEAAGGQDVEGYVELYTRMCRLLEALGDVDGAEEAWRAEREWRARLTGPLVPRQR